MTSVPSSIEQPSRPLTRSDYKTLSLSALGGALEFYDFIILCSSPQWSASCSSRLTCPNGCA